MKVIKILVLFIYIITNAQNNAIKLHLVNDDNTINIEQTVDSPPLFEKCNNIEDKMNCFMNEVQLHIKKNFLYPQDALEKVIQGKVITVLDIEINGKFKVYSTDGPDKILEDEARRIFRKLPKIKPALKNGIPVKVRISVPITFKLY